jgi:crossover junction endodeoxyribonuclease RusA
MSLNQERKLHWSARSAMAREWRDVFAWMAVEQKIPPLTDVHVTVEVMSKTAKLQDPANCYPSAKAAIDGLVQARVLEDDLAPFLQSITFLMPKKGKGDAFSLLVDGELKLLRSGAARTD